jgi:translation elongation factor EF-1alpha
MESVGKQLSTQKVILLGAVDSGKATLCGHLGYYYGAIPEHKVKFKQDRTGAGLMRYNLGTYTDRREKERMITIHARMPIDIMNSDKKQSFFIAPGHSCFWSNAISAAKQADIGVLVVSADKGEFEAGIAYGFGMTRSHALLAAMLHIRPLIVCVTKMDREGAGTEARYTEIVTEMRKLLLKLGLLEKDLFFVPISGWRGDNLFKGTAFPFYAGPPLTQLLLNVGKSTLAPTAHMDQLIIQLYKMFCIRGERIISGRIMSGSMKSGEVLTFNGVTELRCESLRISGKPVEHAMTGDFVTFSIGKPPAVALDSVDLMVSADAAMKAAVTFEMKLYPLRKFQFREGYYPTIFLNGGKIRARIMRLSEGELAPEDSSKKQMRYTALCKLARPVIMVPYKKNARLGTIIIIENQAIIACGKVSNLYYQDDLHKKI